MRQLENNSFNTLH